MNDCLHEDLDRVGATEVVCFQCHKIAKIQDLLERKPDAWKEMS